MAGFDLLGGVLPVGLDWDPESSTWLRRANLRPQLTQDGARIAPTNVVVLETRTRPRPPDRLSPEAQTLGSGTAWVFTTGRMIEGRWDRTEIAPTLAAALADGQPIRLTPGNTWVELPSPESGPRLIDADRAATLLEG